MSDETKKAPEKGGEPAPEKKTVEAWAVELGTDPANFEVGKVYNRWPEGATKTQAEYEAGIKAGLSEPHGYGTVAHFNLPHTKRPTGSAIKAAERAAARRR